jgi:two-component system response regulator HydG
LKPGSTLREVERAVLRSQLQAHQGSRAELARKLGISERSLYRRLREI